VTALVILEISDAFNTIDHETFLERLATEVGVTDIALSWIRSYHSERNQDVSCADHLSSSRPETSGVTRESVLGPLTFCMYTQSLEQIIERDKIQYHF